MKNRSKLVAVALAGTLSGGALVLGAASAAVPAGAASAGGRAILAPLPGGVAPGAHSVHGFSQVGSFNWSGWAQAAANGTYQSVVDTWKVPTVNTGVSGTQYSSDWVGIGGLADSSLVQAGTEADNFGGTAFYQAWTEVLPAAEDPLTLNVHPGDKIKTSVKLVSGVWHMKVKDVTTGKSAARTATQASAGSSEASAEAIHERPCIIDGCTSVSDLANLTQTTNVTFDPGKYGHSSTANTALMTPASGASVDQILMVNNADTAIIASPSNPDSDNDGFTVADGSTSPPPPSS
jgi:Peptidase A4 family